MLLNLSRRSAGFALALILISAPLDRAWAQSLPIDAPTTQGALQSKGVAKQVPQPQPRRRCSVKRRLLTGAAVGFLAGVLAVREAAKANDGTADAKDKLGAGVYGAALFAGLGLATCRP
jgi:hypothetical protein